MIVASDLASGIWFCGYELSMDVDNSWTETSYTKQFSLNIVEQCKYQIQINCKMYSVNQTFLGYYKLKSILLSHRNIVNSIAWINTPVSSKWEK